MGFVEKQVRGLLGACVGYNEHAKTYFYTNGIPYVKQPVPGAAIREQFACVPPL